MSDKMKQWSYRLGAIFYVIWGLLHFVAAYRIYELGTAQDPGSVQARLFQGGWNMAVIAVMTIVIAAFLNWKNSRTGYWLNLLLVSFTDIGFILLLMLPGYSNDILGPITWILGAIFSTIGIRSASQQASSETG
jgi:hypothetical protein